MIPCFLFTTALGGRHYYYDLYFKTKKTKAQASFASGYRERVSRTGTRTGTFFFERDGNMASKDIAESPTAIAGTPKERLQDNKTTSFFS